MPRSPLPFASTSALVVKGRALSLATEPSTNSTINGRSPVIAAQSVARSASPRQKKEEKRRRKKHLIPSGVECCPTGTG
ncbi:hypothetical protein HZ326_28021 [Fusarium oxysporum f. sp. albedinis]|nr:hypothetical protein HZ326_28021 [Fusarium oxysporum f. sp. albedinis]